MLMEKKLVRMKELVNVLSEAAKAYYSTDQELMSNQEYDSLYDELEQLEKETGIQLSDSPVNRVGYDVVSSLNKIRHEKPALSLDKTKSVSNLQSWLKDKDGVLSWKLDGLTVVVTLDDGRIQQIVTRGNGEIGEDVSHLIPAISGLPQQIPFKGKLVVRGECVISYEDFDKINESMTEPYKNPRNLASGSLRLLDAKEAAARKLQFFAFTLVDGKEVSTVKESYDFLSFCGFNVVEHWMVNADTVADVIHHISESISDMPIPTDGLVLAYDDIAYGKSLGQTSKYPNHSIAFKWEDEEAATTLKYIEWSASKSGLLNPVAVFEPVELEGTTVKRASLCNLSEMKRLGIGADGMTTLTIVKSNMIIPKCIKAEAHGTVFGVPETCPVCGEKTGIRVTDKAEFLYCPNPECAAKHVGKFERLVCRAGLNVVGLAESAISEFVSHGWIKSPDDIYYLTEHAEEIMNLDGFGKKSYEKLVKAIEESRNTTFKQFFYSLGIHGTGSDVANILAGNIAKTGEKKTQKLYELLNSDDAFVKLVAMDGIGEVTAGEMVRWFTTHKKDYRLLLNELNVVDDVVEEQAAGTSLSGLTFVITGSLNSYANRDALKAEIESMGGKVAGSVSKNTSYLINNDVNSNSGKNKKAKELGIEILSEADYIERWRN